MKKNNQLKAVATYDMKEWKSALPGHAGATSSKPGYAPLRSKEQAAGEEILLRLDDRGLAEVLQEMPDLIGSVEAGAPRSD